MDFAQVLYKGFVIDAIPGRHRNGTWVAIVRLGRENVPAKEFIDLRPFTDPKDAERESIELGKRIIDGREKHTSPP